MQSSYTGSVQVTLFGESHGEGIGAVITGLAPGIPLDLEDIQSQMEKRRAKGSISTARQEEDRVTFVSGYFDGLTTGTPLCLFISNSQHHSRDYEKTRFLPRPSHADYAGYVKYAGCEDYRGGGHFSGRLTAPLVAAGAIFMQILKRKNIQIATHILRCKDVWDTPFPTDPQLLCDVVKALEADSFPTIHPQKGEEMQRVIQAAKADKDSVGGILETVVTGLPAGIGEPFFDGVESVLSRLLFSIPAVKGVEFGLGFQFAEKTGSEANDPFYMDSGTVKTKTNHNGGINGGITNGMPILIKTVVKPTPSIFRSQETVNLKTGENAVLSIEGRHDPAIIHRARVVADSVVALGLVDLFCQRYGYQWMGEKQ